MSTRITVDQLEQMKTYELADLLANIVLVLRRMPDVPCKQLQQEPGETTSVQQSKPGKQNDATKRRKTAAIVEEQPLQQASTSSTSFTEEELKKKTIADLKKMANNLHVIFSSKAKKDELISKILSRQGHEHSEQYAMMNV